MECQESGGSVPQVEESQRSLCSWTTRENSLADGVTKTHEEYCIWYHLIAEKHIILGGKIVSYKLTFVIYPYPFAVFTTIISV